MDDPHLLPLTGGYLLSLLVHALLSGSDRAFATVKEHGMDYKGSESRRGKRIERLLQDAASVSVALSIANLASAIISIAVFWQLLFRFMLVSNIASTVGVGIGLLGLSIVHFVVWEIWARRFSAAFCKPYMAFFSGPISVYYRLLRPIWRFIAASLEDLNERLNLTGGINHQKILAMVEEGGDSDLQEDERAMIHSIIEFGDIEVHEIMVPRTDMVGVQADTDPETIARLIQDKGHSRLPLFADDVDHIVGIIHVKDLLSKSTQSPGDSPDLRALAREAYFVPESKRLDDLLRAFREEKHHMAIVVDEYGGTAGLVTLEDVLEEIVGDIQDEYDKEQPLIEEIDDGKYIVDPKIDLHELNESLGIELPTEGGFESLAGLILSLTDYVPAEGESVNFENFVFLIRKVNRNRIVSVEMTRKATSATEVSESPNTEDSEQQ